VGLDGYAPSPRLAALVAGGTAPLGARTRLTGDYWAAIAELLDLLVAGDLEIAATAQRLGVTTGALSKLLLHDDPVARAVNDRRGARARGTGGRRRPPRGAAGRDRAARPARVRRGRTAARGCSRPAARGDRAGAARAGWSSRGRARGAAPRRPARATPTSASR